MYPRTRATALTTSTLIALITLFCVPLACLAQGSETMGEGTLPAEPAATYFTWSGAQGADAAARLGSDEACRTCHQHEWEQWNASAHHYASLNNPWYRDSLEGVRERAGDEAMRMCGGCHDPALLPTGALFANWEPDDPLTHAGVSCVSCHRAERVTPHGNASLSVNLAYELPSTTSSAAELAAHGREMSSPELDSAALCIACHRGVLSSHSGNAHTLVGMDDASDWANSAWAGNGVARFDRGVEARDCVGCHMRDEQGRVDHHARGSHTLLARARGDSDELAALAGFLQETVRVGYGGRWEGARDMWSLSKVLPPADEPLTLGFYLRNLGAGHRFPGGTLDAQGARVEVEARWYRFSSLLPGFAPRVDRSEVEVRWLRAEPVGPEGEAYLHHQADQFSSAAWNTTIGPRDGMPLLVSVPAPPSGQSKAREAQVLVVAVRLVHQRHRAEFRQRVCERSDDPSFRAFERASAQREGGAFDACADDPPLVVSSEVVALSSFGFSAHTMSSERWWEFGMALSQVRQERLFYAEAALSRCRETTDEGSLQRARCDVASAHVLARQGRRREVADLVAAYLGSGHPAEVAARWALGNAHARVWDWRSVVETVAPILERGVENTAVYALLARASGAAGDDEGALAYAQAGLSLNPWSFALRRSAALSSPSATTDYLGFRPPDDAASRRAACWSRDPSCEAQSLPGDPITLTWETPEER